MALVDWDIWPFSMLPRMGAEVVVYSTTAGKEREAGESGSGCGGIPSR